MRQPESDSAPQKAVVVIAASARAAAESLRRAGYEPHAVDAFGDRETRSASRSWTLLDEWRRRIEMEHSNDAATLDDAPDASERMSGEFPWVLGGGLAESIEWLDDIPSLSGLNARRASLANQATFLRELADAADVAYPETYRSGEVPVVVQQEIALHPERWLVKPIFGTGGLGIHVPTSPTLERSQVLQRRTGGRSVGVSFCLDRHEVVYLGAARQWSQRTAHGRYVYKGSVGPVTFNASIEDAFQRIGNALMERLPIQGPCNVDVLIDASDRVTLLEVNPRFSASMELLEWSWSQALAKACSVFDPIEAWRRRLDSNASRTLRTCVKRILFAGRSCTIEPTQLHRTVMPSDWRLTDTPMKAVRVDRGDPVATILAPCSRAACRAEQFFNDLT
ncbi:MAG: ATP-grasp domain-containing protein [Planctomycetota bacterium]